MDESDIKVSVVGDSSNIDQTFAKVERGADKMADGVVKSSKKAADGLTGMGEGAEKGAEGFNRAEGRMAASIKRVTLDLQTLGKAASEKMVAKIEMQGLDAAKMQPYIDALREAERAAAQAKTAQEAMAAAVAEQAAAHKLAAQAIADEQRAQASAQAQQQQFLVGLTAQADKIGKTASQMAELRAQQLGVEKEAAPMIAKMRESEQAMTRMGGAGSAAGKALQSLVGYVKVATAALGVRQLVGAADQFGQLSSRMAIAAGSADAGAAAFGRLMDMSQRVYKPISETAELYIRTSETLNQMGYSAGETLDMVEALSYGLTVSAASGDKASGVIDAWSKSILKGKMDMQAFTTVISGAPRIQQALADSLGVTNAGLMEMVLAGKMTADQMLKVTTQMEKMGAETDAMPVSVADAFVRMQTSLVGWAGEVDKSLGATKMLTGGLNVLSDNIGVVATGLGSLTALGVASWMGAATASTASLATGFGAAAIAARGFFVSLGPLGWAIALIGTAATAWQLFGDRAREALGLSESAADRAISSARRMALSIGANVKGLTEDYKKLNDAKEKALGISPSAGAKIESSYKEEAAKMTALGMAYNEAVRGVGKFAGMSQNVRESHADTIKKEMLKTGAAMTAYGEEIARGNNLLITEYTTAADRLTKAQEKQAAFVKAEQSHAAALLAAGKDLKKVAAVNAAYETEIANIKEKHKEKAASGGISTSATELAGLMARIEAEKQRAAYLELSSSALAKLNDGEKLALQYAEKIKAATDSKTKSSLEHNKALAEQYGASKRANDMREAELDAQATVTAAVKDQTLGLQDQIATYGLGKSAIEAMIIARLEEKKAALESEEGNEVIINGINKEIAARKELSAAMAGKEFLDKQKKAWTEWESDVKQMFNRVGQSLTDAIFDGGKSGKDLLKGLFKGLTFNVLINPIMGALQGAVTNSMGGMLGLSNPGQGGAGSSGISAMNMLSMAKNAYSAFTGGITSSMSNSIGWLGQKLGSTAVSSFASGMAGFTALGTATGAAAAVPSLTGLTMGSGMAASMGSGAAGSLATGGTFGAGSSFAAALPVVGWIAAGMMANQSLYKQGWDANNGSMNTGVGAVFGGATGSIHKALEGLGMSGSMASLLSGSAITSRLFGMKNKEYGDTSIVGSLGASGFTGNMETPWSQKGGLFRSNKSGVQYGPVSGDMQNSLSSSFTLMQAGISAVAESVGVASDSLNFYSEQIKITLTSDVEKNQEIIANALAGIGERMVTSLIPTIADYARESETASQTLQRLSLSLSTANIYLKQVQNSLLDVSLAGADAAAKLGDAFGGLDKLGEVTQAFYMVAYTEGERAASSLEGMSIALQSVGAAMPKSVRELREMALALDLTTDSGRAAYATLLTIAPEFAAVTEAMKRLAQEAGAALLESFASRGALVQAMAGAEDTALLADQISALQNSAAAATIDFARFTAGLDGFETDSFVAAISLAFKSIGERIKTLIGDIASERIAVRTAAQEIIDPGAMAPDAIRRQIAGINTALPGNAGVVAAGVRLSAADAAAEQARRHEEAARNTYMPAKAAYDSGVSQAPTLQAQYDNLYSIIQGKEGEIAIPRKYSEGRKYVRDLQATMPALYEQLNQIGTALNQAKAASAQGGNVANLAAAYAQAVSASAQASAAANAAALDAKKSQTAYADSLQAFAIDAGKSVSKLSSLREETMRYYEAQKALADLMKNSAASIRQTAADYRFGQLDPEDQFKQLKSDFNRNYSMALSTDGDVLAGYADKLNSLINPMLAAAQDMFASDAQYNSFVAQVLARTESIAGRLDTLAPADYEQTSLGLLSQIDATLAALDESTRSAEAIITDAINASRDATVNGLRQIANALSGQPIAAFATGGFHTGGLRIVGENGPELEATGPSRIFSSSQTRQMLSGGNGNAEMVVELRALREEVSGLRAETRATASHTAKTARQLERMEIDGMLIRTDADTPIQTEVVA